MAKIHEHLISIGACFEGLDYANQYSTAQEVWDNCERADWLLWWAGVTEVNPHSEIILAASQCTRRVLRFIPEEMKSPLWVIEAAERYAKNPSAELEGELELAIEASTDLLDYDVVWTEAPLENAVRAAYILGIAISTEAYMVAWAVAKAARAAAELKVLQQLSRYVDAAKEAGKYAWIEEHKEMCTLIRSMLSVPWVEPVS